MQIVLIVLDLQHGRLENPLLHLSDQLKLARQVRSSMVSCESVLVLWLSELGQEL